MNDPPFTDEAPQDNHLTDYDRAHLKTYLRLLDAADDGADWREAVAVIFGLDPQGEPARAQTLYDSHLARARWISAQGYRDLVWGKSAKS